MNKAKERLADRNTGTREAISLWHLVQDLEIGHIQLPPHQRHNSWPPAKQTEYITYLFQDSTPPGNLEVYQVQEPGGELSPRYLNEGHQRSIAARYAWKFPAKFNCTQKEIDYILKNTSYPYTLVKHKSHEEALLRFQISNSNIPLTPYQMAIGDIIYCEGDAKHKEWQQLVDMLHKGMFDSFYRICKLQPSNKGKKYLIKLHKIYRFNFAALYRFLSRDKALANISLEKELNPFQKSYCEAKLGLLLKDMGYDKACSEIERFLSFLKRKAAYMEDPWFDPKRLAHPITDYIRPASCQWFILLFIWAEQYSSLTETVLAEFTEELLRHSCGRTDFKYTGAEGEEKKYSLCQGRLTTLSQLIDDGVCKTDLLLISNTPRKRRKQLPPGYHHSHVKPFGKNGEGETIVEPAGINLSRGMKEIEGVG